MNRSEALRILGLPADASPEDIKVAYREMAQILHPDRFTGNRRLQDRATEQFKNLQEAYDALMGKHGARRRSRSQGASMSETSGLCEEREIEARLAGIAASRVQLVAQRDALGDARRIGIGFFAVGALAALICCRRPAGLLLAVTAISSAAAVWGALQTISAQRGIAALEARLDELTDERKKLTARLDELRREQGNDGG